MDKDIFIAVLNGLLSNPNTKITSNINGRNDFAEEESISNIIYLAQKIAMNATHKFETKHTSNSRSV